MPTFSPLTLAFLIVAWPLSAWADAPKVAKASPDDGAIAVDPATVELRVTFDQDMNQGGMSFVGGGPTFPADPQGKARWVDARTIVLPLRLEPGKDYQLSVNSSRFQNFRNLKGEPAVPYPIRLKTATKSGGTEKELTEPENRAAIDRLRKAIDEDYSYRDRLQVDWPAAFREATPELLGSKTPLEFAKKAAKLVGPAEDLHFTFRVGDWMVPTHDKPVVSNFQRTAFLKEVPGPVPEGPVTIVKFNNGITYLVIASWSQEVAPRLEAVFEAIGRADPKAGLIVDVRPNGGGSELLAKQVAGCFVEATKVYAKYVTRSKGVDSPVRERSVSASAGRPKYRGPVVVLMGPATMSSCESFVMMMKQSQNCTLVGDRTRGSSGNPRPVDLGNGVSALVPSWRDLDTNGRCIEGEGIKPDVAVKAGPADFQDGDPVLRKAVEVLLKR